HTNITRRMLAMNQLSDRVGAVAIPPLKQLVKSGTPFQKIHAAWILQQLGALDESLLSIVARDSNRGVRVHAMRILSETPSWTAKDDDLATAALRDVDPYVERAAADALGQHPAAAHVQPLLEMRHRVTPEDAQRLHQVRMSLRNQLQVANSLASLQSLSET